MRAFFNRAVLVVVVGLFAAAATAGEPSAPAESFPMPGCACGQMMAAGQTAPATLACPMTQQCAKAGMPNALLAMKFKLGLTQEQVTQIGAVLKKAQDDSLALLTAEQRKALESLPVPAPAQPPSGMPRGGGCPMPQGGRGGCPMMQRSE